MATIFILRDILAFSDLKLKFQKSHTSTLKRKEMAYELWTDDIFQLMDFMPTYEFNQCVKRYNGNYKIKKFTCREQFLCMAFAQLM